MSTVNDDPNQVEALRKQLQQALQQQELFARENARLQQELTRYKLAASGANDGLWDWDLVTNETFISPPWCSMLGYTEVEIKNKIGQWEDLLHPEDEHVSRKALQDYIVGIVPAYDIEFRLLHKNGTYRWIRSKATVLRDMSGNPVRISGSHTDVTEKKKAEEALSDSERRFRNLFENSLVAMFRSDLSTGKILDANQKTLQLFELESIDNITTFDFYVNEEDRINLIEKLRTEEYVDNQELNLRKYNGDTFWVSFSARLYRQEGYIEAVLKDITESKENLLELQRLNFELDNFVYHASHDLRSPLRSIIGLINILKQETQPSARQKCIEMIEGSINRLDKFVVDLLSMSRANRTNEELVPINFVTEINNSFTNFFHASTIKNLQIGMEIKHAVPFFGPLTQVRVILNNLISNAIKYRKQIDGEISYIFIKVVVTKEYAHFIIEDNGEGIAASKLPHIFEMFYRASENSEGSGLGMYIVKNIITKMGGKITLESIENVGSTFSVKMPNHLPEEEPQA